jgi:hypothetical protein
MNIPPSESFVRWQSATRKHFTATSNLVLGLATGLLAFVSERCLIAPRPSCYVLLASGTALLLLISSIGLALWCSINRLRDFRATAQIARQRANNQAAAAADHLETKALGQLSWRLFSWQLVLFGLGAAASAITVLARAWS